MAQQQFYYYAPDSRETQNMQYEQQRHMSAAAIHSHPEYMMYQQPIYQPRPQSAGPQMQYTQQPAYISHAMLTPDASPHAHHHKPTIMLQQNPPAMMPIDTNCPSYFPTTPTLSASGQLQHSQQPSLKWHDDRTFQRCLLQQPDDVCIPCRQGGLRRGGLL